MTSFLINVLIPRITSKEILIHFEYYLPNQFMLWEDKNNGSIKIIEVFVEQTRTPLPYSSIETQIQLRRTCWDYLEHNHLFHTHNIVPLPFLGWLWLFAFS